MPNVPMYWFKAGDAERVPTSAGTHRFVWDLRYPTPPALDYGADGQEATSVSYGIIATAILGQSPRRQPVGPLVAPGSYTIELTTGGQTLTRSLEVRPDPRVTVSAAEFAASVDWQLRLSAGITASRDAIEVLRGLRQAAHDRVPAARATGDLGAALATFDRAIGAAITALAGNRTLASHLANIEFADMAPNANVAGVLTESCAKTAASLTRYQSTVDDALPAMNRGLASAGIAPIAKPATAIGPGCGRYRTDACRRATNLLRATCV
jgi:hypothetical protein